MDRQTLSRMNEKGPLVLGVEPDAVRIADLKERFRKLGIASYRINDLDEDASILSYLRAKDSFRYAFVREPYGRGKNLLWRLFRVDIWRPSLPMGYWGSPGFFFDYLGEDAMAEAIKVSFVLMGGKYRVRKLDDERVSMKLLEERERPPLTDEEKEYLVKRNYLRLTWPE